VHHILVRCRINRLSSVDRATADLVHADMKKLGNIPDGGGWRFLDRRQGRRNRAATPNKPRNPEMGTAYVHTVLDDHSQVVYSEAGPTGPRPMAPFGTTGRVPVSATRAAA
jgi:hypothetical protein